MTENRYLEKIAKSGCASDQVAHALRSRVRVKGHGIDPKSNLRIEKKSILEKRAAPIIPFKSHGMKFAKSPISNVAKPVLARNKANIKFSTTKGIKQPVTKPKFSSAGMAKAASKWRAGVDTAKSILGYGKDTVKSVAGGAKKGLDTVATHGAGGKTYQFAEKKLKLSPEKAKEFRGLSAKKKLEKVKDPAKKQELETLIAKQWAARGAAGAVSLGAAAYGGKKLKEKRDRNKAIQQYYGQY